MTGSPRDYRTILADLTSLDDQAAAHRAEAQRWYTERIAAVDEAEQAAMQAREQARRRAQEAERELDEVSAHAAGLWSDFVHRTGPAAERFGRTVPEAVLPRQRDGRGPHDYLREVAGRLAYIAPARPLTSASQVLCALFGAVGGLCGYAAAHGLRVAGVRAGGDWAVALPVVALIVMLIGPALGIAGAKRLADRRGVPLDATTLALVIFAGTATTWLLYLALR